jgi:hypothetical protein
MTERLLQFIWRLQYFDKRELTTLAGEPLRILAPGEYNSNQGPDFQQARIRIRQTTWAGNVELHLKTSDWNKHRHQHDQHYENVILHVVWQHDAFCNNTPVLELESRISKLLLRRYDELMNSSSFIPCEKMIHTIPELTWKSWKDRLLAERLLRKADRVKQLLQENHTNWEETFWWLLARGFGTPVNAEAFEAMARSVPLSLLAKHKNQLVTLEALLLGQAGLLEDEYTDEYPRLLQREYQFYRKKYRLRPSAVPVFFLRMRPPNFPTVRLAQLAALVKGSSHLFTRVKEAGSVEQVRDWLSVTANDYWHTHYSFETSVPFKPKKPGAAFVDTLIINTISPVLFAYGDYHREQACKNKALLWLEQTAPEQNYLTRGFKQLGVENLNAFDSQALIELKNEYCNKKRCLDCGVGSDLLKRTSL